MRQFEILGEPKGKGRPRFFRRGNFTGTYTPKETANYENLVRLSYVKEYPGESYLEGPLSMSIISFCSIPKSFSKVKQMQAENNDIHPIKKPDVDNLAKIIADSLNKIAYEDDKQIVLLSVKKAYARQPKTVVEIKQIRGINAGGS